MSVSTSVIADLCIYLLTWNVGTHSPKDLSLTSMLELNGTTNCPQNKIPDIYVIGMQEVSTKQVLNIFQDDPWVLKLAAALSRHEYVKVESKQLQGILITMFAQPKHIPHMKDIETDETRTGWGGVWGNKGAVSIRLSLYGTGAVFVCSHLAAHDAKLKERIEDYHQIVDNHKYHVKGYPRIFDHDFVFWFGDLNFRLSGDMSAWDVRNAVENGRYDELLKLDQLSLLRESGNAFSLLQEELPTFAPTFKFIEGSNEYDLKRRPAWCDRILHRVQANSYPSITLSAEQLSYQSKMDYTLSDHKPVAATFSYKIESHNLSYTDEELHEMTHGVGTTMSNVSVFGLILVIVVHSVLQF
ncbi:phosphatidylinositol 4,5-bisphosphate 5-phosphatase A isoform X1 [Drosophila hydei]|uniref:Phosphatidylinositol 4,5-bisphosphate 5-phosphatase A isoform X1 n=1 Tax=Drosophila hydei TaxID=7224 RepID=A0A6J1L838_DROHY|nr:phosphatidylinositol 4,5-bisphosphate 5-phosphatase A isoform X1 [Drosophila hydei]XP_023161153.1 phosphatidylinositol 4,5-bisphosphate 5-phosphatase A isoform X1 [Drosophila hydei]XP_023161160.1 phosphatidylinositol 4,5-bisphosphate 5-phosphatase A isoform X1 [Drosophila hydei]